jgi:hypothetical protein
VPLSAVVLLTLAVVLALFGIGFAAVGMSGERGYWSQRDPEGDPATEATPLRRVAAHAFSIAVSDARAPLRIAAIGVVMVWVAVACAVLGVLLGVLG